MTRRRRAVLVTGVAVVLPALAADPLSGSDLVAAVPSFPAKERAPARRS
jgi:hypothetical protein